MRRMDVERGFRKVFSLDVDAHTGIERAHFCVEQQLAGDTNGMMVSLTERYSQWNFLQPMGEPILRANIDLCTCCPFCGENLMMDEQRLSIIIGQTLADYMRSRGLSLPVQPNWQMVLPQETWWEIPKVRHFWPHRCESIGRLKGGICQIKGWQGWQLISQVFNGPPDFLVMANKINFCPCCGKRPRNKKKQ